MNIINSPQEHFTNQNQWWFIYDSHTDQLISPPMQCEGYTTSPFSLCIDDSEEACWNYIRGLSLSTNTFEID